VREVSAKNVVVLLVVLAIIGAGAASVYLADKYFYEPLREQKRLVENLQVLVDRLTKDVRVAEVAVVGQQASPLKTTFRFVEVDEHGARLGESKTFTIDGDEVYFDTLVIKFEERFKPLNDLMLKQDLVAEKLLGKSIIFFRRIFGAKQRPEDGFPLDAPNNAPGSYRGKLEPTKLEQQLWKEFWELAVNPTLAKERGVRAAHGQAVSTKLVPGKYFVLERRLSGDLTIRPVDVPAVMQP
jgi:hypothetical protein